MAPPKKKIHLAEIVRHGDKLIVPDSMSYKDAIDVLLRRLEYEEEWIDITENIDAFPWDGALALFRAMEQRYGWANHEPTPGFFGPEPPKMIGINVSPTQVIHVPWGRFSIPNVQGYVETGTATVDGRAVFTVNAHIRRKYEEEIQALVEKTRELARSESIYRAKAIRIRFRDSDGNMLPLPEPKFLTTNVDPDALVFNTDLMDMIETNIFTPLRYPDACRETGIPLKRGVLAAGPYGTGKTLLAHCTSKVATENGWTFIYLEDVRELPDVIRFASQYSPAVIFAEDVDRATTGERTVELDQILNTLDGIDSKNSELMVILTTNHVDQINQAMLRPGRLDVVLNVLPPDQGAVKRLIQIYGRDLLDPHANLERVAEMLNGEIPAVIREVVERSKLAAIKRTGTAADLMILDDDLIIAANTMDQQKQLLAPRPVDRRTDFEKLGHVVGEHIHRGLVEVNGTLERVAS